MNSMDSLSPEAASRPCPCAMRYPQVSQDLCPAKLCCVYKDTSIWRKHRYNNIQDPMTRTRRLGANVRLIRVAGTVPGGAWVFLPRGYTSQVGIRVSIRRAFGSTSLCPTGSPSRRNHRKPGSRTLPLTTDSPVYTAGFPGFLITSPLPQAGARRSVTSCSAGQNRLPGASDSAEKSLGLERSAQLAP